MSANPNSKEIAETLAKKEEVKTKWTNPDGSMKKGYMLAPNGKPTKLSKDQWLTAHTPAFKEKYGTGKLCRKPIPKIKSLT